MWIYEAAALKNFHFKEVDLNKEFVFKILQNLQSNWFCHLETSDYLLPHI